MKRQISTLVALSCLLSTVSPALCASVQVEQSPTTVNAQVQKTQTESSKGTNDTEAGLSINREFTYVAPEQIPVKMVAVLEERGSTSDDLNNKILGGYFPVRLTVTNQSGKLLKVPFENIYFVDAKGNTKPVPTYMEVFNHAKRHGVRRALAWSIPLGVASFGILLIPAAVWSSVHTAVTNNTLKTDIQQSMYKGGYLNPEGTGTYYLYLPKSDSEPVKLVFGRVINAEDELETETVAEIKNKLETAKHGDAK